MIVDTIRPAILKKSPSRVIYSLNHFYFQVLEPTRFSISVSSFASREFGAGLLDVPGYSEDGQLKRLLISFYQVESSAVSPTIFYA